MSERCVDCGTELTAENVWEPGTCKSCVPRLVPFKHPLNKRAIRWAIWSYFDIESKQYPGYVYLRRLRIIQTPWFGWYIHWIFMPDLDQDPHDHPWNFWALILRGGYKESHYPYLRRGKWPKTNMDFYSRSRIWKQWSLHKVSTGEAHRIRSIEPDTISMVWVGHRQHEWGFYTPTGYIDWRVYNSDNYQEFINQLEGTT